MEAGDLGHSQPLRQQHWIWLMFVGWLFTAWLHLPNAGEALGAVNLSISLSASLHRLALIWSSRCRVMPGPSARSCTTALAHLCVLPVFPACSAALTHTTCHWLLFPGFTPHPFTSGAELLYSLSTCITHVLKYIVPSLGLFFTDVSVDASCSEWSGASAFCPNWYSGVCLLAVRDWPVIYGSEWKSTCLKRLMMCACWLLNRLNDI